MPYKEKPVKKLYYNIGEVAAMFNVATSAIRFWETQFGKLHTKRTRKGNRIFTQRDIDKIQIIYFEIIEEGRKLAFIKRRLRNHPLFKDQLS